MKALDTRMERFTAYRTQISKRDTHNADQKNPDDVPQFEGVIFSDGTCVIRWLTPSGSHSVWGSVDDMLRIHGHPEYGTIIIWHDGPPPHLWTEMLHKWTTSPP